MLTCLPAYRIVLSRSRVPDHAETGAAVWHITRHCKRTCRVNLSSVRLSYKGERVVGW